jgi:alkaline phosphatase
MKAAMQWLKAAGRIVSLWAASVALLVVACQAPAAVDSAEARPRNVIIMLADGVAPTQWEFGRYSSTVLRGQPFVTTDVVFRQGAFGLMATRAADAYVTDSAAAASAMSTGRKANIGTISVAPDGKALTTVMEAARAAGKRTGLVTTTTLYDATPAAFAVHERSRRNAQSIVDQYAAFQPELLLGGGADYFLPKGKAGGKRSDGTDVTAVFEERGYTVVRSKAELDAARGARLLGLFADGDMAFEIDSDASSQPGIVGMTVAALKMLERDGGGGFVLLIENENTDSAGHANDAAALMRALWAFDDAVKVVLDFQRRSPGTLVIVTGDHETGGLAPGSGGEAQLRMLGAITMSFASVEAKLGPAPSGAVLDELLKQHFAGFKLAPELRELILTKKIPVRQALARMVAMQTGFLWATTGHTAEPVAVGAVGPGAALFRGYQDNTDFGRHLHALLRASEP